MYSNLELKSQRDGETFRPPSKPLDTSTLHYRSTMKKKNSDSEEKSSYLSFLVWPICRLLHMYILIDPKLGQKNWKFFFSVQRETLGEEERRGL